MEARYRTGKRKTNWRIVASPVRADDLIILAYPYGRTLFALNASGKKEWVYEGYMQDVCTPAVQEGQLYILEGKKRYLTCLDPKNGREIWQEKIPSSKGLFASPLVADGKNYMINLAGEVFIYQAGKSSRLIKRIPMSGKDSMASIIAVDDSLYIRTPGTLMCIQDN